MLTFPFGLFLNLSLSSCDFRLLSRFFSTLVGIRKFGFPKATLSHSVHMLNQPTYRLFANSSSTKTSFALARICKSNDGRRFCNLVSVSGMPVEYPVPNMLLTISPCFDLSTNRCPTYLFSTNVREWVIIESISARLEVSESRLSA